MKIVYLLDSLNRGGAEVMALDVCRNAVNNGLKVIFVATGGGVLEEDFANSGVEFIRLYRRLPLDMKVVSRLRGIIKSERIDVVHVHQAVEAIHAYFAAFGTKTKIIFTHHGFIPDKKNLYALKFLLPRVKKNIVCSQSLLNWYRDECGLRFPGNTLVIRNGVDEKRLTIPQQTINNEFNIPKDSLLIGMIGNFYRDARKDQLTLCRALPQFFAEIPNAYCVFAGKTTIGGEYRFEECRKICDSTGITKRVIFAGQRSDIPVVLNSLDIFVLSSLHEGFPIAVLEAMLSGIPCLLSDIKPNLELSLDGEFAEIFESQNENDLANKLISMAKDKDFSVDLRNRAKDFALREYGIQTHINNLKSVYESVVI